MAEIARTTPTRTRLESVDVVRGVIMMIMALDHTRDFFGVPGQNPTNLATAGAALFLTRWVTNICAPVFFLLTGVGAYLGLRRRSPGALSRYLLSRGIWLIVLEVTIVRCLAYQFNADYQVTMLLVLWALGWAMITLAAVVRLPPTVVGALGVLVIAGHNLLDGVQTANPVWSVLHAPGFVWPTPPHVVFVSYPLVPWIGVTAAGFGLGQVYGWNGERRRRFLVGLGLVLCVAFVAIRWLNAYGDPFRWTPESTVLFTVLSALNTSKYPPSLLFLLMTLGPALLLLASVDHGTPHLLRPALIIGKVPLFYYVLHFFFIHLLAVATCYLRYGAVHWMFESPDLRNYPFTPPPGWGFALPVVYLVWMVVVIAMYPLCHWFAGLKQRRSDAWLGYV